MLEIFELRINLKGVDVFTLFYHLVGLTIKQNKDIILLR